jgi:hypothetical protein
MDILTQSTPTHIELNKDIKLNNIKNATDDIKDTKASSNIISREELLMGGLIQFFSQPYNLNQLLPILDGTSPLSLRVLDWFVTNYSKQYDIIYSIKKGDSVRQFVVHNHYKAQLKGYSKRQFDPFCRRKRVFLEFGANQEVETTVGQLNFFKWAIENKVLDYVQNNLQTIVDDMNLRGSKAKKDKEKDGSKPLSTKKELSISATKTVTKHDVVVTVKFN